ncbi:MAG: diaminopimelate decarboxylase [Eubacteriales bacterium]
MFIQECCGLNSKGHLTIGGADAVELARQFGTPAYIMDEGKIRSMCRVYRAALEKYCGEGSVPLYASKALSCKALYRIVAEEGLGADAVSCGEIYTARAAGFDMSRIYFHGNNKTDADIRMALGCGVGTFVCDNHEELDSLDAVAGELGINQKILLRITPGIDPHTHKKIITGNVDSKFGTAIVTGQAMEIVKYALAKPNITLAGFHCHVGSQIFENDPFDSAASIMIKFIADVRAETGYTASELNLGGGLGVPYTDADRTIDYDKAIGEIAASVDSACAQYGVTRPRIMLEPGRAIVAAAGVTLYTVGSVKEIPGFRNYVSVDGGMPDNPRYALYQSQYDVCIADRAGAAKDYICTVAGRCCESGDLIGEGMALQSAQRGDILAVFGTGAYNYSMASNYNRIPRPPVIMIRDGKPYVAVRRESFEDLCRNDV